MTSKIFSIVTIFQIWAYPVMYVYKLSEGFYQHILYYILGKVTKYEFDTCTSSIVIKIFFEGGLNGIDKPYVPIRSSGSSMD